MKILKMIWNILPEQYRWSVAIKKVSYTVAKVLAGGVVAMGVGKDIDPTHMTIFQEVLAATVAGGLTIVHDWLQVKYPNAKWL